MGRIWNYDNKVYKVIGTITDCFLVSLLWIATSLPLVTIGASTAALYHTIDETIVKQRSYITAEYFSSFKSNLKQAILTWLIFLFLFAFLIMDLVMFKSQAADSKTAGAIYYFFLVVFAFLLAWCFYLFPYIARFQAAGVREIMFKSFSMMIANPGWSLLLAVIFYVCFLLCNDLQFFFFLFPGGFCYIKHFILEKKVFPKYMQKDDLERQKAEKMELSKR